MRLKNRLRGCYSCCVAFGRAMKTCSRWDKLCCWEKLPNIFICGEYKEARPFIRFFFLSALFIALFIALFNRINYLKKC
jgi:hypothetical protein